MEIVITRDAGEFERVAGPFWRSGSRPTWRPGRRWPAPVGGSSRRGASRCMLFTDLSNPTANKIYAEIGYRRFAEWEELVFDPD